MGARVTPTRLWRLGVALVVGAGLWDLAYHLTPGQLPAFVIALGELGHTVIFAGIVLMIAAVLLKRERN